MKYQPHNYQIHSIEHIMNLAAGGLFLEPGLGKTSVTLTAINRLMYEELEVSKVLVVAPLRVAQDTWPEEVKKWDHLSHLKLSLVLGSVTQRVAALKAKADIWVINRENVAWLVTHYQSAWPFDMVVIDELSSFKSNQAGRFKALRMIRPKIKRIVGLTGTPAPNGLMDLWSQLYLLDMGTRLGKTISWYRDEYFILKKSGFGYKLRDGMGDKIHERISDICISMKAKDWLELPERIERVVNVHFDEKVQCLYDQFERDQVMLLLNEQEITAMNAAALTNKLLQFANGAIYDDKKQWHEVHTLKLDMLEEMVEGLLGKNVLVSYGYKHDAARILKRFGKRARILETTGDIHDWNKGKIEIFVLHPASAGHGLNLQTGGHNIMHFSQTWSLELRQQFDARLDRQGQVNRVLIQDLVACKSMDEEVLKVRSGKTDTQEALMQAVKARIDKILNYDKV
jgi:SNF2 family DNA or RNA helicase